MEIVEDMPKTNAQPKVRLDLFFPESLVEEIKAIAEADGWTVSELCRFLMADGLAVYAEKSNKRMINQRLRKKMGLNESEE